MPSDTASIVDGLPRLAAEPRGGLGAAPARAPMLLEWALALAVAAVLTGCDGPDRVGSPDNFPMHARIGDVDHHGRGSVCLPLDAFGACPAEMTFFPERMGLVHGDAPISVVLGPDVRILPGAGPDDVVLRPGERSDAAVSAGGVGERAPVSDFEIVLDGSTRSVEGTISSTVADVFEVWGDLEIACPAGEPVALLIESGEERTIRCSAEW